MLLYRIEKKWLKEKPEYEIGAAYMEGKEVLVIDGETSCIHVPFEEREKLYGTVFTHWHPVEASVRLTGKVDSVLSVGDIGFALTCGIREIRVVNGEMVHSLVLPSAEEKDRAILDLDMCYILGMSIDSSEFAKKYNCKYFCQSVQEAG
jgi:hypothetical protein